MHKKLQKHRVEARPLQVQEKPRFPRTTVRINPLVQKTNRLQNGKNYAGLFSVGAKRSLKVSAAFLISLLFESSSAFFSLMLCKIPVWLLSTNCRNSFSKRRTSPTGILSINPLVAMNRLSTCFSTGNGAY